MKLSEMRQLLSERGIQLTKSLGQNFLHDQNQLQRIAGLGELMAGDKVLEIGPGLGPLTELLLDSGAHVFAIEKDQRLCAVLEERFNGRPNFELRHDDALEFLKRNKRSWAEWKLISNLPYSVASPILVELALAEEPPERLVATLQLEVVERIMAAERTEHYGQLSLFLQVRYEVKESIKIPAGCFFPPPDVDSGCVLLCRRKEELLPYELMRPFLRIVKRGFSARRKMMAKLLKQEWPVERIAAAFAELGIDMQARAETVSLVQFVELTKRLACASGPRSG
jgi:16S rRNA (adenine1518-N6/adenine1519-N6)-dimethyltransferase